jgi:acetyltransferase-like isoleucine patch superfamily enzyme
MDYSLKSIFTIPKRILKRVLGIPFSTWFLNFLIQRIFRLNSQVNFQVHFSSQIVGENIRIGSNVWKSFALSGNCYIQCGNGVDIGEGTIFAPGVKIISANHDLNDLKKWKKGKPVIIGKDCWIGSNVIILPEVELGDNIIVGAGSVVTKSFEDNQVIAGNPARVLKKLNE